MAKIVSIETELFRLPLDEVLVDAKHGEHTHFELVTATIKVENGLTGTGYTYTGGRGGASIKAMIDQEINSFLFARDASKVQAINESLQWHLHYVGRGGIASFAISAIDIALWDIRGKNSELPLWKMIGGTVNKCRAYCGGIDLNFPLEKLLKSVSGYLNRGVTGVKIKVGQKDLNTDVLRVQEVRKLIGSEIKLIVDANYSMTVQEAIEAAQAFQEFDILWFEEPTEPDDFFAYSDISDATDIAIAMGENLHTLREFSHALEYSKLSYIQPDASNCGGITCWLKVAQQAEKRKIKLSSHCIQELHVSLVSGKTSLGWIEIHSFPVENYTLKPVQLKDGFAVAPNDVVIGVNFDWDKLRKSSQCISRS